jgi:hypothetical protein
VEVKTRQAIEQVVTAVKELNRGNTGVGVSQGYPVAD